MKRLVCLLTALGVASLAWAGKTAAAVSGATEVASGPGGSPNILLIVADDLAFSDLSLAGAEIQTPHIDQLAREGTLFRRFYTGPTCAPTRAMLLTGVDAHDAGFGIQGGSTTSFRRGLTMILHTEGT